MITKNGQRLQKAKLGEAQGLPPNGTSVRTEASHRKVEEGGTFLLDRLADRLAQGKHGESPASKEQAQSIAEVYERPTRGFD